ncbi:MAG: GAF domain-containing sensor histidine kinase, partial [Candidatus Rifleibacteriota bacterium]
ASQKKILENTLKNGFWRGEVVNFDPEGNEYFLDCRTNVVYDQEGKKIGLCGISSDITERKNTQKNLVKYKAELEVRNKITRIFLTISDENIYAEVLNFILEILGSRYGIFGYINENGDWVCPSMTRDIWEKCKMPDKEIVFRREIWGGLWGKAMLEKKSLYSNKNFNVPSGHIKISRALDVPVLYKGKLIGNLLVGNKKSDYDEEDLKTLEKIADYISPILSSRLNFEKQKKEKERTRKQLLHAQKLESVGRLAGGVAHDYNNMLGVILGYAEMVLNNESVSEQVRCDVQEIYSAAERASEITQQLLAFAHKQAISPKTIDLNEAVEGMLKMLRRLIGEDIELAWFPGKKLWVTNIDSSQLDQILVNLCLNSRDALTTGGKITIETRNVVVDEEYSGKTPGFSSGEFIMLCVSDNGSGMDKETLEGIFEPFFTTKKFDKGKGLGLATVYGIVQQNKGFINVNTEPSEGTTVKIYLPRSEAEFTEIDSL